MVYIAQDRVLKLAWRRVFKVILRSPSELFCLCASSLFIAWPRQ